MNTFLDYKMKTFLCSYIFNGLPRTVIIKADNPEDAAKIARNTHNLKQCFISQVRK